MSRRGVDYGYARTLRGGLTSRFSEIYYALIVKDHNMSYVLMEYALLVEGLRIHVVAGRIFGNRSLQRSVAPKAEVEAAEAWKDALR